MPTKSSGGLKRKVGPMPLWAWGVALGVGLGVIIYLRARAKRTAGGMIPATATGSAYTPLDQAAAGGGTPASPNTGSAGIDPAVVSGWLGDYVGGITATTQAAFGLVSQSQQSLVDALSYETALSGYSVTSALQLADTTTSNAFSLASQAISTVGHAVVPSVTQPAGPGMPNPHPPATNPPAPAAHSGVPAITPTTISLSGIPYSKLPQNLTAPTAAILGGNRRGL